MNVLGFDVQDVLGGAGLALAVMFGRWAAAKAVRQWFGSKEPG